MDNWKDDIERYISGKMSPAERHALEKRALSDPFLADALEGAESISTNEFSLDVSELNQKIAGAGKNRWLWPLRIAASVIGVAIVGSIIFLSIDKDDASQLASSEQKSDNNPTESVKADSVVKQENSATTTGEQSIAQAKPEEKKVDPKRTETKPLLALKEQTQTLSGGSGVQKSLAVTSGPDVKLADTVFTNGLLAARMQRDTIAATEIAELVAVEEKTDDVAVTPPTQQPTLANSETKTARARKSAPATADFTPIIQEQIITGQVRDQQGEPLPGVNINIKGTTQGAVTNAEGKYSIALVDPNSTLVYSFIGFVPQEMKLDKAKDYADVQLMEDATQLSEVVVTGYGEKRTDGEPVVRLAEPIGGMKAYDKYLEEKKIYPQQALDNKVEGKVVIEFTVSSTGAVSEFNVIKKIGYGCEEELIRIVKEGPGWYPTYIDNEAVESLVRVKTRFELPEKK
jgi:TonB family protein